MEWNAPLIMESSTQGGAVSGNGCQQVAAACCKKRGGEGGRRERGQCFGSEMELR
jgi:hypothetical protein